jgi:3-isopropylmalate/(R)-2-methylmalate dehydratase small subunit
MLSFERINQRSTLGLTFDIIKHESNVLNKYLMEDLDPEFTGRVQAGDIGVAGSNFGRGSTMEVASLIVRAAGIQVIVAPSFARTYYRNAINGGLLSIKADNDAIADQDRLRIVVESSHIAIHNLTTGHTGRADARDGLVLEIFAAGGVVNYIRSNGSLPFK